MAQGDLNKQERGVAAKEYALVLALIAVAVISIVTVLGASVAGVFEQAVDPMLTPPAGGQPDWSEDFEDPELPNWDWNHSHGWQENNGQLVMGPQGEVRGFSGDATWSDYTVQVRAVLYQGRGYGIYFRATGAPRTVNAYIFQYDPGYDQPRGSFLFRKIVDGRERSPFARIRAPEGFEWRNVWRDIQINVEGDTFTAYIDGQPVLQASDDSYPVGRVGLRTWWSCLAGFDDFQVTLAGP